MEKNAGAYFDLGNAHLLLRQSQRCPGPPSGRRLGACAKDFWEAINNQGLVLYELGRRDRRNRALAPLPEESMPTGPLKPMLAAGNGPATPAAVPPQEGPSGLASEALAIEPNYVSMPIRKNKLWGSVLRSAPTLLSASPS